jgi:hypothetical protein
MPNYKPRPETRREFMNKLVVPYDEKIGNPNQVYSETVRPGQAEFNRSYETSMKGDTTVNISVGLEDMDQAIDFYFKNVLKLSVYQNNQKRMVPVMYANPEKWKSIQADGFLRDTTGKIQAPLITYRRDNVEPNRTLGNKLDGNQIHNFILFEKKFNSRNFYDNFNILTNRKQEKEFIVAFPPDYVTATYTVVMFTDYVEQMNDLIEAVNFASNSYWGDPSKFQFKARIDSFPTQILLESGEDRTLRTTYQLTLNGYIIPDSLNREVASVKKMYGPAQIVFGLETAGSEEVFQVQQLKGTQKSLNGVQSADSVNITNTVIDATIDPADLAYLNASKAMTATVTANNTAVFSNTSILQPTGGSGLPPTTKTNFNFYANGITIPGKDIISLSDVGSNVVMVVNTSTLGYFLTNSDGTTKEVIGVGKFA